MDRGGPARGRPPEAERLPRGALHRGQPRGRRQRRLPAAPAQAHALHLRLGPDSRPVGDTRQAIQRDLRPAGAPADGTAPEDGAVIRYRGPPMCCQYGVNTHSRDRCQAAHCGCERVACLALRQIALQQAGGPHPSSAPPPPDPPVDFRWQLICQLDGTLEIQLNKALFADSAEGTQKVMAEIGSVITELGTAKPAELDDV